MEKGGEKAEEVRDSFARAFPNDSFQIIHANNFCISCFHGDLLLNEKLFDDNFLIVLKMRVSEGKQITNTEVFQSAFPWVYESMKHPSVEERRDFLYDNIRAVFEGYHALVLMFKKGQSWAAPYAKGKANAVFADDYGDHDVIVVLY